ncbi:MAG: coiled coil domain-containing protein [Desulfobacteraceae bacterium]|jgi:hypothetical protein|nr:coiled coil domain-containing protein [Desulfobacteraceae bacterium]
MVNKEQYKEKVKAQLREWDAKIDQLKAKADRAKAEFKIDYTHHLEELRSKRERTKAKLEELKVAGDKAWESVKDGLEKASADLKRALDEAVSKFK